MLVKLQCSSCGAPLEIDSTREVFFCKYCGMKLVNIRDEKTVNINKNVNVSGTVVHQRDTSHDPNLYVEYSTMHPQFSLMVTIGKESWILAHGEKQFYKLPAGKYPVKFKIAKSGWTRDIYIPFDNTPVRIKVLYAKTTKIYIDQPPQGMNDYQYMQNQEKAAQQAQIAAQERAKELRKAEKAAAKEEKRLAKESAKMNKK